MANPKAVNFSGNAGMGGNAGLAQIFGTQGINPYMALLGRKQAKADAEKAKAEAQAKADEADAKMFEELRKNPQEQYFADLKFISDAKKQAFDKLVERKKQGVRLSGDVESQSLLYSLSQIEQSSKNFNNNLKEVMQYKQTDHQDINLAGFQKRWQELASMTPDKRSEYITLNGLPDINDPELLSLPSTLTRVLEGIKNQYANATANYYTDPNGIIVKKEDGSTFKFIGEDGKPGVSNALVAFTLNDPKVQMKVDNMIDKQVNAELFRLKQSGLPAEYEGLSENDIRAKVEAKLGGKVKMRSDILKKEIAQFQQETAESNISVDASLATAAMRERGQTERQNRKFQREDREKVRLHNTLVGASNGQGEDITTLLNSAKDYDVTFKMSDGIYTGKVVGIGTKGVKKGNMGDVDMKDGRGYIVINTGKGQKVLSFNNNDLSYKRALQSLAIQANDEQFAEKKTYTFGKLDESYLNNLDEEFGRNTIVTDENAGMGSMETPSGTPNTDTTPTNKPTKKKLY